MNKCEHKHISREILGYQDGIIDEKGIHFGEIYDIIFYWCNDCKRHLTTLEMIKLNL